MPTTPLHPSDPLSPIALDLLRQLRPSLRARADVRDAVTKALRDAYDLGTLSQAEAQVVEAATAPNALGVPTRREAGLLAVAQLGVSPGIVAEHGVEGILAMLRRYVLPQLEGAGTDMLAHTTIGWTRRDDGGVDLTAEALTR